MAPPPPASYVYACNIEKIAIWNLCTAKMFKILDIDQMSILSHKNLFGFVPDKAQFFLPWSGVGRQRDTFYKFRGRKHTSPTHFSRGGMAPPAPGSYVYACSILNIGIRKLCAAKMLFKLRDMDKIDLWLGWVGAIPPWPTLPTGLCSDRYFR